MRIEQSLKPEVLRRFAPSHNAQTNKADAEEDEDSGGSESSNELFHLSTPFSPTPQPTSIVDTMLASPVELQAATNRFIREHNDKSTTVQLES